jgi:hypothetical protein
MNCGSKQFGNRLLKSLLHRTQIGRAIAKSRTGNLVAANIDRCFQINNLTSKIVAGFREIGRQKNGPRGGLINSENAC